MPPTANCVLSVAVDAACAAAVGLETDCATPSHATVARLAVIINTAQVRVMAPRFFWPLLATFNRPPKSSAVLGRRSSNKLDVRHTSAKAEPQKAMRFSARAQKPSTSGKLAAVAVLYRNAATND